MTKHYLISRLLFITSNANESTHFSPVFFPAFKNRLPVDFVDLWHVHTVEDPRVQRRKRHASALSSLNLVDTHRRVETTWRATRSVKAVAWRAQG